MEYHLVREREGEERENSEGDDDAECLKRHEEIASQIASERAIASLPLFLESGGSIWRSFGMVDLGIFFIFMIVELPAMIYGMVAKNSLLLSLVFLIGVIYVCFLNLRTHTQTTLMMDLFCHLLFKDRKNVPHHLLGEDEKESQREKRNFVNTRTLLLPATTNSILELMKTREKYDSKSSSQISHLFYLLVELCCMGVLVMQLIILSVPPPFNGQWGLIDDGNSIGEEEEGKYLEAFEILMKVGEGVFLLSFTSSSSIAMAITLAVVTGFFIFMGAFLLVLFRYKSAGFCVRPLLISQVLLLYIKYLQRRMSQRFITGFLYHGPGYIFFGVLEFLIQNAFIPLANNKTDYYHYHRHHPLTERNHMTQSMQYTVYNSTVQLLSIWLVRLHRLSIAPVYYLMTCFLVGTKMGDLAPVTVLIIFFSLCTIDFTYGITAQYFQLVIPFSLFMDPFYFHPLIEKKPPTLKYPIQYDLHTLKWIIFFTTTLAIIRGFSCAFFLDEEIIKYVSWGAMSLILAGFIVVMIQKRREGGFLAPTTHALFNLLWVPVPFFLLMIFTMYVLADVFSFSPWIPFIVLSFLMGVFYFFRLSLYFLEWEVSDPPIAQGARLVEQYAKKMNLFENTEDNYEGINSDSNKGGMGGQYFIDSQEILGERVSDIDVKGGILSPIFVSNVEILPLSEACEPIYTILAALEGEIGEAERRGGLLAAGMGGNLSQEMCAAIFLYTSSVPLFSQLLNQRLRTPERSALIPFLPFLKHLFDGLSSLPFLSGTFWCGIGMDEADADDFIFGLKKMKEEEDLVFWWSISSLVKSEEICSELVRGENHVLFQVECQNAVEVKPFSAINEEEYLLLPAAFSLLSLSQNEESTWIVVMKQVDLGASLIF